MVCGRCGTNLTGGVSYCGVCGARQGRRRGFSFIYTVIMLAAYGTALLTCFICDMAINHGLSWFYIVLVSVMLSFSITNLPVILKRHKTVISAASATLMTYLLLYICCPYQALSFAFTVATVSLAFAWLILAVIKYLRVNPAYKAAVLLILSGAAVSVGNPLINMLLYGSLDFTANNTANIIVSVCLTAAAVIAAAAGAVISAAKRER